VPLQAITAHEPIPGYRIRDRLGAGGYGEVWKADAPGGLVKAIKFVYGHLNEERASRELKALNRIKSVRHPFLLSLERIEVVDGQLLIVTELAEKSLKDRFDQCLEQGLPGIPRDELLRYLQDTADVLDYMNEAHCLQHLDIKPENLLLLAGRVKVADFGLVKDLHEATASIMGGLTPLYAPPEVFDGRPSHWSDQYSLAIVYQEMLTGELPFPGSNAMQLARQHMHSRPRLTALPPADQPVVARALAKTPEQRFANCRELVHTLASAAAHGAHAKLSSAPAAPRNTCQTEFGSDSLGGPNATRAPASARLPRIDPQPRLASVPPLEPVSAEHVTEPILYIGIGGTGARVATKLNQYFASCRDAGMPTPSPCVAVVDTDAKDLAQVARLEQALANPSTDWIPVPLRQPQHYRRDANRLLAWISRRWLFNIPRSLKTDGLRPLGRLALVDHIETIRQHVADALISSSEQTPPPPAQQGDRQLESPHGRRVVLVASISGGTGSGMILDLGFLVRQMLEDVGRDDVSVHAILLHSTGRTARWKELAAVNAYAALAELHYFGRLDNSFPGDPSCGLRARPGPATPFDDVNLIHLGADLDEPRFLASIDRVVDHLALDTPHMAGPLFDACRAQAKAVPSTETRLITSGTCVFRCLSPELMTGAVEHICRGVVERWIHGTQVPPKNWLGDSNRSTTSLAASETERPPAGRLTGAVDQWFVDDRYNVEYILDNVARALDT